jgi:exodeoxyribonuclease VII large subunit
LSDREPPDWALPAWDTVDTAGPLPRAPSPVPPPPGTFGLKILAVSDVTRAVHEAVRGDERLRDVWVEGEVGRVTISSAGHGYFTLKDERSQLSCVWFRDDRLASAFEPQAGLRVVAHGRVDVFDAQGVYQLYVTDLQPAGFGDLALRFEALKARLAAEGLFERARKRPLPDRPRTIAVVTSPTGAVWHDISTVLRRRWPLAQVVLSPCLVQGEGAAQSVVRALGRVERWVDRCHDSGKGDDAPVVTILARGGGSLEDLWAFNDERVVRAVVAHKLPVVAGVGHETDVTLADFAADVRAPTPSAAAELVVPDRVTLAASLAAAADGLERRISRQLGAVSLALAVERRALDRLRPSAQLAQARERAGVLLDRATRSVIARLVDHRRAEERLRARLDPLAPARIAKALSALDAHAAALAVLGPQATLDRGYAIVRRRPDGRIVRDPSEATRGARLGIRLARGEIGAIVDSDVAGEEQS